MGYCRVLERLLSCVLEHGCQVSSPSRTDVTRFSCLSPKRHSQANCSCVARPGGLATRGKLVSNCFLLPQTPTETVPLSGERKHSRPDGSQINRIPYVFDTLQNVTIEFRAPSTLASYQTTRIVVCPAYEYQTTRMQRSRPGSSLFSPSPSVEGRSSVEARDRTRPTPRSRARRLVHAFTPSARREQVPQSCSPPATEPGYLGGHLSPSC